MKKYILVPAFCLAASIVLAQEPSAKKIADQGNEKGEKKSQSKQEAQQLKEKPEKVTDSTHKATMHNKKTCGLKPKS